MPVAALRIVAFAGRLTAGNGSEFAFSLAHGTNITGFDAGLSFAAFTAIPYIFPATPPFFAPGEFTQAQGAVLAGQVDFLVSQG
jgi:hypothetical protein